MMTIKKIILGTICLFFCVNMSVAQSLQVGRPKNWEATQTLLQPGETTQAIEFKTDLQPYLKYVSVMDKTIEYPVLQPSLQEVLPAVPGDGKIYLPGGYVMRALEMTPLRAADNMFSESWESYDGVVKNWIPDNWSKKSKAEVVPTEDKNKTWYIRGRGPVNPSHGNYMAWINFDANKAQDEWLISPSFTPEGSEILTFDLYYSPFYMYYTTYTSKTGEWVFDFVNPKATLQVYVSVNNGDSWTLLWDLHDQVSHYNRSNIQAYTGAWYPFRVNLGNYSNRNIRIAYCYKGKNGDSMALDNIGLAQPEPKASYKTPAGYFNIGLSKEFYSLTNDFLLGHAYHTAKWINSSNEEAKNFTWTFPNTSGSGSQTYRDSDPEVYYPAGQYKVPVLKAETSNASSVYSWGSTSPSYFQAGGHFVITSGQNSYLFGAGNYLLENGIDIFSSVDGFAFGTTANYSVDAIANYYEKPTVPYVLENMWVGLGLFTAPANQRFDLIIHRVVETPGGMALGDTIATATCRASDVSGPLNDPYFYSMPFKNMKMFDRETGLYYYGPVEIEDAILVELKGFNRGGASEFAALGEVFGSSSESNAYIFQYSNGIRRLTRYMDNTSLLFNLGLTYTYFLVDTDEFKVSATGGTKVFNLQTNVGSNFWWLEEALPDWLTETHTYQSSTGKGTLTLKATALPQGVDSRTATVNLRTYGAGVTIRVVQNK